jgi:hypothetical protein
MSDESKTPEKKIIIDEDWKSQVEAEKMAAAAETPSPESPNAPSPDDQHVPLPPPDLMFLVGTFYLQAAIAMGLMPNPTTNKAEVQLDHAQHSIDLLTMLQQKTEGNRTQEESDELEAVLHQLRLTFVTVKQQMGV